MTRSELEDILSEYDKRAWPEILAALVRSGFITEAQAARVSASVAQLATDFSVLAEATLHDQALQAIQMAEDAAVEFSDFEPESFAIGFDEDGAMAKAIVEPDLTIGYQQARRKDYILTPGMDFLRFTAVLDNRTTEICRSLDGTMLSKDNDFWKTHSPPLHANCRSTLVGYSARDAGKIGISSVPQRGQYVPPEEGWGSDEFKPARVLAKKDHMIEAIARAKLNNPLR